MGRLMPAERGKHSAQPAAGFLSRVYTGSRTINHILGYAIVALAVPSTVALVAFIRARAGWRQWIGPGAFLAFIALMVVSGLEHLRLKLMRLPKPVFSTWRHYRTA